MRMQIYSFHVKNNEQRIIKIKYNVTSFFFDDNRNLSIIMPKIFPEQFIRIGKDHSSVRGNAMCVRVLLFRVQVCHAFYLQQQYLLLLSQS